MLLKSTGQGEGAVVLVRDPLSIQGRDRLNEDDELQDVGFVQDVHVGRDAEFKYNQ
jgi:hypothetical protein